MSFDNFKDDIRIRKTKKSLNDAMTALLEKHSFKKITIKDICEKALTSRATFYSHFIDKYDLLRYWLAHLIPIPYNSEITYDMLEKTINPIVEQNKRSINNIFENADYETLRIMFDVLILSLGIREEKNNGVEASRKYVVYSNLFAGGIVYYILWHVENKFPTEIMNIYLYDLIKKMYDWEPQ